MVKENIKEYSVSEISNSIKNALEDSFGYVRVRGEISGLQQPSSGHMYFNLKDENAVVRGIIWKSNVLRIGFRPEDGLEVVCSGKLTTGYSERYPGRSDYAIHIDSLKPSGEGALMALLEERKKKFKSEGLFDESYKKNIPFFPQTIGIITSPTGAVIKDILHRLEERFPCEVLLWPVPVQGEDASELISNAVTGFNQIRVSKSIKSPDVIIIARGGGSIEDLWAFNEENVVRSVFSSKIPIISAVGHETDTTLIDFVSDLRAPTPTAAAELCTPVREKLNNDLSEYQKRLSTLVKSNLDEKKFYLNTLSDKLPTSLKLFANQLHRNFQSISSRLNIRILKEQLNSSNDNLVNFTKRLIKSKDIYFNVQRDKIISINKLLESLSYKSIINRGYSVIKNSKEKVLKSKKDILSDKKLIIETKFGILQSDLSTEKNE
tara:strand:+ start:1047 stop:2351 length:1305 start_codon:yes stop_codon:yes gene_type:complete